MRACGLAAALGREEPCPEEACAFWERGGRPEAAGCVLDSLRLDVAADPALARELLSLRRRLESARGADRLAPDERDLLGRLLDDAAP